MPLTSDQVREALCMSLTGRADQVTWKDFVAGDWRLLANMAQAEGVAPLLYWTFRRDPGTAGGSAGIPAGLPARIREGLARTFYYSAAQNTLLLGELVCILNALEAKQVPVILLKGAVLAEALYPDVATRPMNDLDLLTQEDCLEMAIGGIESCGYRTQKTTYHVMLQGGPQKKVTVELHWNLMGGGSEVRVSPGDPMEWFWEQAEPWTVSGGRGLYRQKALALSPTAHLLYLAAHLMLQHAADQPRLMWFYDIHEMVRQWGERVDWELLAKEARAMDWTVPLYGALKGAQERFQTCLPEGYLEELVKEYRETTRPLPRYSEAMQKQAVRRWMWGNLTSLKGMRRLRMLGGLLMPAPAYMRWRYQPRPAWLWPLCYPYRWWDLLMDGVRTLVGN